jgi:hypothetical protein
MKEPRKISAAEVIWLICFVLLCFYPPTVFGKVLGLLLCALLAVLYVRGRSRGK